MPDDIVDPKIARRGGVPPGIPPDDVDDPKLARQVPNRPKYETTVRGKRPTQIVPDVRATMPQQRGTDSRGTASSRPTDAQLGLAAYPQPERGSQPPTAGQLPARHGPTRLGQQAPSGPSQLFRTTTYHTVTASPGNVPILDPHGRELGRVSSRSFADLAQEGNGRLPDGTFVNAYKRTVVADANTYRPVLETAHGAYRNAHPATVGIQLNNPRDRGGDIDLNTDQVRRVRSFTRENAAGEWGRGAFGRPLVPYRSIAVDPRVVPRGTRVYIQELDGMPLPDGSMHDGWVTADDIGGRIRGQHFDIFT